MKGLAQVAPPLGALSFVEDDNRAQELQSHVKRMHGAEVDSWHTCLSSALHLYALGDYEAVLSASQLVSAFHCEKMTEMVTGERISEFGSRLARG